jgi:hypothetical protein
LRQCLASTGTSSWSTSFSSNTFLCMTKVPVDAQCSRNSKDPQSRNLAHMPAAPTVPLLRPSCASHLVTQILLGCVTGRYCITETSRPGRRARYFSGLHVWTLAWQTGIQDKRVLQWFASRVHCHNERELSFLANSLLLLALSFDS